MTTESRHSWTLPGNYVEVERVTYAWNCLFPKHKAPQDEHVESRAVENSYGVTRSTHDWLLEAVERRIDENPFAGCLRHLLCRAHNMREYGLPKKTIRTPTKMELSKRRRNYRCPSTSECSCSYDPGRDSGDDSVDIKTGN